MPESIVVLRRLLAVAGLFALAVPATRAQPVPEDFGGVFWGGVLALGPDLEAPMPGRFADYAWHERGFGRSGAGMPMPPPPHIVRGLALTEAQQDKVFGILHGQAPALRAASRAARSAHDELSALASSVRYDATKARALADAAARANAEVAMLRAEGDHQIFMTLTREQRESLELARPPGARP